MPEAKGLDAACAAFENAVTQQTQAYQFKQTPNGGWLFKCDEWFDLSRVLTEVEALSTAPVALEVKPLEWRENHTAETPFGSYAVCRTPDGYAAIFHGYDEIAHVGFNAADDPLRAAKDHAQADYDARIRSALHPAPVSREAVIEGLLEESTAARPDVDVPRQPSTQQRRPLHRGHFQQ